MHVQQANRRDGHSRLSESGSQALRLRLSGILPQTRAEKHFLMHSLDFSETGNEVGAAESLANFCTRRQTSMEAALAHVTAFPNTCMKIDKQIEQSGKRADDQQIHHDTSPSM